jgi:transposase-like protein
MNLLHISNQLDTKEKCIRYLEEKRWNGVPTCTYCGSKKTSPKKLRHTCLSCGKSFSVTVGTVFQSSNLALTKWFMAISIMLSAKKGISAMQLSREISVNKNTAWLLQMKIRNALDDHSLDAVFPRGPIMPVYKFRARKFGSNACTRNFLNITAVHEIGINSVWSRLKRAIIGQYHRIDVFYFHRYVDEFKFKISVINEVDYGYKRLFERLLFGRVATLADSCAGT